MPELRDLYQEVILEHSKAPRNYKEPAHTNHKAEGYNPLCGDRFTVYLEMDGDTVRDIGHSHETLEQMQAELGKLAVFSGVSEFPMRVKCATLAWHTLEAALEGKQEKVSTE
jgi:nitrogen fixation NifU-like protein